MPCRRLRYDSPACLPAISTWLLARNAPGAPGADDGAKVEATVRAILKDVAERGEAALVDYTRRFDCPDLTPDMLAVAPEEFDAALAQIPADDLAIIEEAATNIRDFHKGQVERSWWMTNENAVLGQLVHPVERAGLYVPGGLGGETPLISSMLMTAIPAQVAGVPEIVAVSPPRKDGTLNPYILAAAKVIGLTRVFKLGSAWAVAALAYGAGRVPAVDVIAGPGNIWVTTAKRIVSGEVGIDIIAGPSEIAILADAAANPAFLAADMLSQAEHDPLASCLLVSDSQDLLDAAEKALADQLARLPRSEIATTALANWGALVLVPDIATGCQFVNRLAPEHLELALTDPWAWLGSIRNAGAIFLGQFTPEPVGDYFAGPNHVLPTMGAARFSSALSVQHFCKKSSVIAVNQAYMNTHGAKIARLARLEGLEAHARSIDVRLGQ